MFLTAHIEIPKGGARRTYLKYDKTGYIDIGPIKDVIPVNNGVMPVHYGFVVNTINQDEEGEHPEELDVLVYSSSQLNQGDIVPIEPLALLRREDKDEKIVATLVGEPELEKWEDIDESSRQLLLDYFGYKSKIISIESKQSALDLIKKSLKGS